MLLSSIGMSSSRNFVLTRTRRRNIVISVAATHYRQYHQHPQHHYVFLAPWALVRHPPSPLCGRSLTLRREFSRCTSSTGSTNTAPTSSNFDDPGTSNRRRRRGVMIPTTPNHNYYSTKKSLFHSTTTTSGHEPPSEDNGNSSIATDTNDTVPVVSDDEEEYSDLIMEEYENSASAVVQTIHNMKHHVPDAINNNSIEEDLTTSNQQNNSERNKRKLLLQERKQQAQRLWRSPEEEVRGETLIDDGSNTSKRRQENNNIQTAWTKAVIDRPTTSKKQYFHDPCPVSNNNKKKDGSSSDTTKKVTSRSSSTTDMDDYYRGGWNEKQIKEPDHVTSIDREHDSGSSSSSSYSNRLQDIIQQISLEEQKGGRQRERQLGVLREDPQEDMRALMYNYTVPALASALRDREDTLQYCATLLSEGRINDLQKILQPFESQYVKLRRYRNKHLSLDNGIGFDYVALEMLRKGLARMSRQISQAHQKRAGVVLPLCNVNGIACVLFEKRSRQLRAHPNEVCLPGGMVSVGDDKSIVVTCLREMEEEIGLRANNVQVLGILRCNWGEIAKLTGVAVTPVVGFVGELGSTSTGTDVHHNDESFITGHDGPHSSYSSSSSSSSLSPNDEIIRHGSTTTSSDSAVQETNIRHEHDNHLYPPKQTTTNRLVLNYDEVSECFTVPIETLLDKSQWIHRDDCAPIFVGGPYVIWGLTGYIVDRFVKDILGRYTVST